MYAWAAQSTVCDKQANDGNAIKSVPGRDGKNDMPLVPYSEEQE